jgi:hypothetical protein
MASHIKYLFKKALGLLIIVVLVFQSIVSFSQPVSSKKSISLDERDMEEKVSQVIPIDSVWSGHPVGFCLLTHQDRQYIAYYNANRNMVVGQRDLSEDQFHLSVLPPTSRETHGGTSTMLGWDSHNYVTLAVDKEGFIHLSGNMHVNPLTYFRSSKPNDIATLVRIEEMVGAEEKRCTYPRFLKDREGELLFTYRDGGSGDGNQIYNIYNCASSTWSRLLDRPLTDGQGLMNAYISPVILMKDNWYHTFWVWRDTPDCSTNHDLSYMKSPDLKTWHDAFGNTIELPATLDRATLIVDPIPPKGGIINLAAELCLDDKDRPAFVYHKYDEDGNLQLYSAWLKNTKWRYARLTNWDYRWYFSGNGSINSEVIIRDFRKRDDGFFQVDYWHIKYGDGAILLNNKMKVVGNVLKPKPFGESLTLEGDFPGLEVRTSEDAGDDKDDRIRYILKWETLPRNRDKPRPEPWPGPGMLYLYKLEKN